MHHRCNMGGCMCSCHTGCPISVPAKELNPSRNNEHKASRCNKPLAPGAKFCAKHEADRIRLS